jgi:hypothetical protein
MLVKTKTKEPVYFLDKKLRRLLLYARIGTLAILSNFGKNGASYKDIKYALRIEDGVLIPNLTWLKKHNYVISKDEKIEGKKVVVYYITEAGIRAFEEVKKWINSIIFEGEVYEGANKKANSLS